MAKALSRAALRLGQTAEVHLKIDTGMGRLGVLPEDAAGLASSMAGTPGLRLGGVFSHLATAEAAETHYAEEQFRRFGSALGAIAGAGVSAGIRHIANSAAALRFPSMRLDRVRTGLLVYGITPEAPGLAPLDLRPALVWKTRLAFTKDLPAGSAISYGCTHVTRSDCRVAVLPLGYADGFPRRGSNRAQVLVGGRLCPVIGRVCMDHVIIDASPAGEARPGDEVVLIGSQGTNTITANQLAQWAETCVHEVTTVIGPRVARVYADVPDVHTGASAR
jgi:alanine racemase